MIAIVSKVLFSTSASRAVTITTTRNIYTKEYLGLSHRQKKREEAHGKAGKNVMKIKESFMTSYKTRGIKNLRRYEIQNFMNLADNNKDMAILSIVVKDFLAEAGDLKQKQRLLCACIESCYLRRDLKYSRILSQGAFFQTFDKNPLAILMHFQLLYDHGHYISGIS